ncbi:MAG: hypothetical protein E4H36_07815, partial [Spirochaetales bacterium]
MIKERREFGGTAGNIILILALPALVYYLFFCMRFGGGHLFPRIENTGRAVRSFAAEIVPSWQSIAIYAGWLVFQSLLQFVLPGRKVQGRPLPDGSLLSYTLNGLASFLITLAVFFTLVLTGVLRPELLFAHIGALISTVVAFCFAGGLFLFFFGKGERGKAGKSSLRSVTGPGGAGGFIRKFFLGTGLNPRIGRFDLKLFFEARLGLIGWMLLNFSFCAAFYRNTGRLSLPLILSCAFQFIYVLDYFIHEEAILSTMDVVHERFGFMLLYGDSAWVPFTYSLQVWYLAFHNVVLPVWITVLCCFMFGAGYCIFRATNLQKHRFKADPTRAVWGKKPEWIETETGSKLLVSGFWGWSRHFNYVGDILMALSWSLPCLFGSAVPYFYPLYFAVLLVHRERRD